MLNMVIDSKLRQDVSQKPMIYVLLVRGKIFNKPIMEASTHLKTVVLKESTNLFKEAGRRWNKISEIFERASTSKTSGELKFSLKEAARAIFDFLV